MERPAFLGFSYGHHSQPGCLTFDEGVRLHSCEHGTGCSALSRASTVFITPIISRSQDGKAIRELGAGIGTVDLVPNREVERFDLEFLVKFLDSTITDVHARSIASEKLAKAARSREESLTIEDLLLGDEDNLNLSEFAQFLALSKTSQGVCMRSSTSRYPTASASSLRPTESLPLRIVSEIRTPKASTNQPLGFSLFPTLVLRRALPPGRGLAPS